MKKNWALLITLSLIAVSCSHKDDQATDPNQALRVLAQADRDSIAASVAGIGQVNSSMQQSLTAFFGGTSGTAFQSFLDERIRFFITDEEYASIQNVSLAGKLGKSSVSDPGGNKDLKDANVKVAASNVGIVLWLVSAIEGYKNLKFSFRSRDLVLDSSRVGLMLIGEGYNMSVQRNDGTTYVFPAAYRQSILIHEARHSDCATGLNQEDLTFIKSKTSLRELTESFKKMTCGNLHSYCPESHQYKNLPACDRMTWGAYSAGAMFAGLSTKSATSSVDRRVMELVAADQLSRVLLDVDKMFAGKLGAPDVSNRGIIEAN